MRRRPYFPYAQLLFGIAMCIYALRAGAQDPVSPVPVSPKRQLRVVSFGGFLGQIDGFYEFPAAPYEKSAPAVRKPSGGVAGVADWLQQDRKTNPDGLRLVMGNNLESDFWRGSAAAPVAPDCAQDSFWKKFSELQPDAVALGTEDFLRAFRRSNVGGEFVAWMGRCAIPFLSSNAVIREKMKGMNTVHRGSIHLLLPADETVGWEDELTVVSSGAKPASVTAVLTSSEPDQKLTADVKGSAGKWTAKLKLPVPLRPGSAYTLAVTIDELPPVSFTFKTMRTLLPLSAPGSPNDLMTVRLPNPSSSREVQALVFSAVDPNVRKLLSPEDWTWKPSLNNMNHCPAEECEVDFLPPRQTLGKLSKIVAWERGRSAGPPGPNLVSVLLSSLDDSENLDVLSSMPQIRMAVLPPDSKLLGRAAAAVDGQFSGDFGYHAILNPYFPQATQLWARPEWTGETVQVLAADVPSDGQIANPVATSDFVPGKAFCWAPDPVNPGMIWYGLNPDDPRTAFAGPVKPFPAAVLAAESWTVPDKFNFFLLGAMRRSLGAEIALLPEDYVDSDVVEWLGDEFKNRPKSPEFLSAFILQRALLRSEPIVLTKVPGDKFADVLGKILASGGDNTQFCLSGVGEDACNLSKLQSDDLRINGRPLQKDPGYPYLVALPRSIAKANGLLFSPREARDVVQIANNEIEEMAGAVIQPPSKGCAWDFAHNQEFQITDLALPSGPVSRGVGRFDALKPAMLTQGPRLVGYSLLSSPALPQRDSPAARTPFQSAPLPGTRFFFLSLKTPEISFAQQVIREPGDGSGLFGNIPIAGRDVKSEKQLGYKTNLEAGLDWRPIVIGLEGATDVNQTQSADKVSASKDEISLGARASYYFPDYKTLRVFIGFFGESRTRRAQQTFTPKRVVKNVPDPANPGLTLSSIAFNGSDLTLITKKPLFRYGSIGIDGDLGRSLWKFQFKTFGARFDLGWIRTEPENVVVAGQVRSLDDFLKLGAQGLLNDQFTKTPGAFQSGATYEFGYDNHRSNRFVFDMGVQRDLYERNGDKATFEFTYEWRQYFGGAQPILSPVSSLEPEVKLRLPLVKKFAVAPFVSTYGVKAKGFSEWFHQTRTGFKLELPAFCKWWGSSLSSCY